jgi:hypothetical protein
MNAYEVLKEKSFYVPKFQIVEENIIEYEAQANALLKEMGLNIVLDARRNKKENGTLSQNLTLVIKRPLLEEDE